jgi:hypothetical protein
MSIMRVVHINICFDWRKWIGGLMLFVLTGVTNVANGQANVIAFPGAEGFGRYTTGGRGGRVLTVTNLNNDGPGSFRDAVAQKYPRIIIFRVAGTIALASPIEIKSGDLTIAGQSAPGEGICIRNFPVSVEADNVIIRYMRFRLGDESGYEGDAITGNKGVNNVIIDHCSMSWATDECASFYRNRNFTLQWCIVSESLNSSVHAKGEHGYGGIWGGAGASFHHNLIASHTSRMPRFSGSATTPNPPDELVDFANNVIYNWRNNNIYGGEAGRYNIVNNYFKAGPASRKARTQIVNPSKPFGKFFVTGNYIEGSVEVTQNNRAGIQTGGNDVGEVIVAIPFPAEKIAITDALNAYQQVLNGAGASHCRDAVDKRIIAEVRNRKSSRGKNKDGIIDSQKDVGGWPELKQGDIPRDTDHDGIPDEWEKQSGLNPDDAQDASLRSLHSDYDNIEVYLNSLAGDVRGE